MKPRHLVTFAFCLVTAFTLSGCAGVVCAPDDIAIAPMDGNHLATNPQAWNDPIGHDMLGSWK